MSAAQEVELELVSPVAPAQISVVVCAYTLERWDDLCTAVDSVLAQEEPVGEVIVVIDHNNVLLDRARSRWPQLVVVPNAKTRGLSGSRDTGVAHSSGAVVAFLDDDARARPDWSRELAVAYRVDEAILAVGGWIEPRWPDKRPSWWPPEYDWVVGCSYEGLPRERAEVRNVIGANMSFRRTVLAEVGSFHSSIGRVGTQPTGGEETEICIRARQQFPDGAVIHEPRVRVDHRVTEGRASWRYFRQRCFGEGVSKVRVGRLATHEAALATELTYVLRTLPIGCLRGLASSDPRRGLVVVAGLLWTVAGYLSTLVRSR